VRDDEPTDLFELAVGDERADPVIVTLRGECDLAAVDRLGSALASCTDCGRRNAVLDVEELEFLDCAALNVMLQAARRCAGAGGSLVLRSPRRTVRRLLDLSGAMEELRLEEER
jgi:anti-anti-sigma factor